MISSSGRRRPRSNAMKLNIIFDAIDQVEWDVPKFLGQLFQKEKVDERHERVVGPLRKPLLDDLTYKCSSLRAEPRE